MVIQIYIVNLHTVSVDDLVSVVIFYLFPGFMLGVSNSNLRMKLVQLHIFFITNNRGETILCVPLYNCWRGHVPS